MKFAVLPVLAVMLMVAQQGLAKNVTYSWQLGGPTNEAGALVDLVKTPVCLEPGDFATFKWEDEGVSHNAYNTSAFKVDAAKVSDASNTVDCTTITKPPPEATLAGTYIVDAIKIGKSEFGIICTVGGGGHCAGGMKALVVVAAKKGDCAKRK